MTLVFASKNNYDNNNIYIINGVSLLDNFAVVFPLNCLKTLVEKILNFVFLCFFVSFVTLLNCSSVMVTSSITSF